MQGAAEANGATHAAGDAAGRAQTGPWRRRLLVAAKVAVSVGLLVWVLTGKIDLSDAIAQLSTMDPTWLGFAFAACMSSYGIITLRWWLVLRALDVRIHPVDAWWITWIGMFFNQSLPSNMAGDVMRVWRVLQHGPSLGRAISSVMIDRVAALVGIASLVIVCLPLSRLVIGPGPAWYALIAGGGAILAGLAVLLAFDRLLAPLRRVLPGRLIAAGAALARDARAAMLDPRTGPAVVLLTMVNFTIISGVAWMLAAGLGIAVAFFDMVVLFPPVMLVAMLPVSFAGWGVRELAMVTALGFVGVADVPAVTLSLAFGLTALMSALPGGLVWFLTGNRRRTV